MVRTLAVAVIVFLAASSLVTAQQKVMLDAVADVGVSSVRGHSLDSYAEAPSVPIRQNQNWSGFETKAILMSFNAKPVQGWNIKEAKLHLYMAKEDLYGVGVCEMLAPWSESDQSCWQYASQPREGGRVGRRGRGGRGGRGAPGGSGASEGLYAWPGSFLPSVCWAHPMARFSHADTDQIKKEQVGYPGESQEFKPFVHLTIPIDPAIVAAMAAGTNYGVALTDDKGQVAESYSLIGPGFPYLYNEAADPYVFTHKVQDESLRPRLEVIGAPAPKSPAASPADLKVAKVEPSTSTVTLEFTVPQGNILTYEVTYKLAAGDAAAQQLPRWEIPLPGKPGGKQLMPVWTLPPGQYTVGVIAVDMAGNRSPAAEVQVAVPAVPQMKLAAGKPEASEAAGKAAPQNLGDAKVYVVPDIVKVDPVSGAVLRDGDVYRLDEGFFVSNPVYSGAGISLQSAANEVVAFQVIIEKGAQPVQGAKVEVGDLTGDAGKIAATPNVQLFREWYIKSSSEAKRQLGPNEIEDLKIRPVAWHADAALPLAEPFEQVVNVPAAANGIEGQTNQAVWVDVYVPKATKPGTYRGDVTVSAAGASPVKIPLAVEVLPLALPDKSSWIVELNSYGSLLSVAGVSDRDPKALDAQWGFYRLSKQHRQMFSAIPYKQSGKVEMAAPKLEGDGADARIADWTAFERFYGPLLDGSAFSADKGYVGPNAGTPISEMYTAFHENWPLTLEKWYQDYAKLNTRLDFAAWAKKSRVLEQAFPEEYKKGYAGIARQFAEHCQQKGWTQTTYQIFGNNKYYFKVPYFASQMTVSNNNGSCFWLLDESVDHDDFMANAFFMGLAQKGLKSANAPDVKFAYRVDASLPEMSRSLWNGVVNLWCCSGIAFQTGYMTSVPVRQKWLPEEEYWNYGGGPSLSAAPANMLQTLLQSWAAGTSGILPYWTTDGGKNWVKPSDPDLALFYTGKNYANSGKNYPGPLPSLRLKTMRRAQQDIEYLFLLAGQKGWDRNLVRQAVAGFADDPSAPVLNFTKLSADRQRELRQAVAATILQGGH